MFRVLLPLTALLVAACVALAAQARTRPPGRSSQPFSVVEAGIADMQRAMASRRVTSRELVRLSLERIATYEDRLNATMHVNPRALEQAAALDAERRAGRVRGPLHGIPLALKDNIHTIDMPTTGGALAFAGLVPPYEATLVTRLREAGAVIVAKTVLTELANWVATGMPANYGSLAGYGFNPYDPRRDPRPGLDDGRPVLPTGGSSSGAGTAASFWAANVGTETSGSILNPANQNMLVGIKPTVGRISRYGIIPITADQDTAGPLARSVRDAAILLGALAGTAPDPHDPATTACAPPPGGDYTRFLDRNALKGARIGVPRAYYYDPAPVPGTTRTEGGLTPDQRAVMDEAIRLLRAQGATVVDPADLPSVLAPSAGENLVAWPICRDLANVKGQDGSCSVVFKYGMKRDFDAWLASLGAAAPVKTLTELRAWNRAHERAGTLKYGQAQLDISDEMDLAADRARYEADRAKDVRLAGAQGIDAALTRHGLDALLFGGATGAAVAARPGYPSIVVPFGTIPNSGPAPTALPSGGGTGVPAGVSSVRSTAEGVARGAGTAATGGTAGPAPAPTTAFPAGFQPRPAPFGVTFTGTACSEPRLIAIAYAFEQATKRRVPPPLQ